MKASHPGPLSQLVVAAAIVDRLTKPRRLLAARRSQPAELAGGWEFPGGKVEPGESPEAALHRELREELGVSVVLGAELVGPVDGRWPLAPLLQMRLWWAEVRTGVPAPIEDHDELRWLEVGSWETVAWLPADLQMVKALVEAIGAGPAPANPGPGSGGGL